MTTQTNLRVIRRSRKPLLPGDVFAMQVPDERYLFGRVIAVDLPSGRAPMPGANLLYIYRAVRTTKAVDPSELKPTDLLLPPTFTNRMGWSRGYFQTLANQPLKPEDLLEQHCFWDLLRERYIDERQDVLSSPVEPCGEWGLASYLLIDDLVSDALGIPRASIE